jgi:pyrimidine deaminase RibD-like protein
MNTRVLPRDLALDLLDRSVCRAQVAAVLSDKRGIFAWGWNHVASDGDGMHAEEHAVSRANKCRLTGAKLTVAGKYRKSGGIVLARPCEQKKAKRGSVRNVPCMDLLKKFGIGTVEFRDKSGQWVILELTYVRTA